MKHLFKKQILVTASLFAVCIFNSEGQGSYLAGDFHQHTTYTDGSYSFGFMMRKNAQYGLDWWANSEHGGRSSRWATVSGKDLGTTVKFSDVEGITLEGTRDPENRNDMWRWQVLRDFSFKDTQLYREVLPEKIIIQGLEWNAPGHNHVNFTIIDKQFDSEDSNANAIAEFEYKFDNSDKDISEPHGWVKSKKEGTAKTREAIAWVQQNYPKSAWIVPTHVERSGSFKIEDLRDMNDIGPDVFFGFDSQPGHQKSKNRGGYSSRSYGATGESKNDGATWGGTGIFAAKVGGVWDALLSEGRRFWLFANSDFHGESSDFYPGEYQKTKIMVKEKTAQGVVDGLRSGNAYIVTGDLIDSLSFKVGTATMGETFETSDNKVTIHIVVRDPETANFNTYSDFTNPELDHIDLIAGKVSGKIDQGDPRYKQDEVYTTKVIARFGSQEHVDANGIKTQYWKDLGNGFKEIIYTVNVDADAYFRLRGTHHAFGAKDTQIDEVGNPILDPFETNDAAEAFEDLWFYSNPVFVKKVNR